MAFGKGGRREGCVSNLRPSGKGTQGLGNPPVPPASLRNQYRTARTQLNATVSLLAQGLDLIEVLRWGVLDVAEARAEVDAFKRAASFHKRRQRP